MLYLALPEIFNSVDVFESELPFSWVYDENGITETMKSLSIPLQYLVAAALEVTDVNIFKPSGFTMGMNNGILLKCESFGNIQQIIRKAL